jgi:peptidoglycan/xylan/chitin deacetylase (PgdA/CDA1 family)
MSRRALLKHTVTAAATLTFASLARAQPPATRRKIAVTIDDGPAIGPGRDLEPFLKISRALREIFVAEKVPVIMFVNERQLHVDGQRDARIGVLHQWLDAGLDLGNHTYSHPRLTQVELARYLDDIVKGEVVTRPLLESRGKKLVWFRYPFLDSGSGETAQAVEDFLARRGYRIAPVSVDYHDYSFAGVYARHLRAGDPAKAEAQFTAALQALDTALARSEAKSTEVLGYELPQTLLIHCNEMNSLTLPRALQRMRDRGYTFVSLDEAMEDPAYKTTGLRAGSLGGGGLFNSLAAAKRGGVQRSD